MKIDRQKIGDLVEDLLSESGWTEERDVDTSRAFQRRLWRRRYALLENAEAVLRSFSGITLRRQVVHPNGIPGVSVLRFLSDDYFPRRFANRRDAVKRADVTLLREVFNLHACMVAQKYYGIPDESNIDYSAPGTLLVYAMSDGSFCVCDFLWFYLWRDSSIEDVLRYMFERRPDPYENLLVLDSPEYGTRAEELRLING